MTEVVQDEQPSLLDEAKEFAAACSGDLDRPVADASELGRRVAGWDKPSYLSIELRGSHRQAHRAVRPSASCSDKSPNA
jgi:hypothetical protein